MHDGRSSDKAALRFEFSKNVSNHSCRVSLILLQRVGKCLISLTFSASLGSQTLYAIWIQLVTANILHSYTTLLCPLPDEWYSHCVMFESYTNREFSLDTNPAMPSPGTRSRSRTHKWNMPAYHGSGYLYDEFKYSVEYSERLHSAKHILSLLYSSQDDVAGW